MTKILGRPDIPDNLTGQIVYTESYSRGDKIGVGQINFIWPVAATQPTDLRTGMPVDVVAARFNSRDPLPRGQLRMLLLMNGQTIPAGTIEIPLVETEYGAIDLRKLYNRGSRWFNDETVDELIARANAAIASVEDYRAELDILHSAIVTGSNIRRYLTPTEREYDTPPNGTWGVTYTTNQLHYRQAGTWVFKSYISGSLMLSHTMTRDVVTDLPVAEAAIIQTVRADKDCRVRIYGVRGDALRDRSRAPGGLTAIPIAVDVVVRANETFLLNPPAFVASPTRSLSLLVSDSLDTSIALDIKLFAMNSGGL